MRIDVSSSDDDVQRDLALAAGFDLGKTTAGSLTVEPWTRSHVMIRAEVVAFMPLAGFEPFLDRLNLRESHSIHEGEPK